MSVLSALAAWAAVLGFSGCWALRRRQAAAVAPFGAVCGIMVLLSVAGMLGVLRAAALCILAAGLACLGLVLRAAVRRQAGALCCAGFAVFAAGSLVLLAVLAVLRPELWAWDEFSFWGTAVKLIKTSGGELYTTATVGWPWPATQKPGLPVLAWWFGLWGDFTPWTAYFGYAVLLLAAGCAAAGRLPWRLGLPAAVMGCLLPFCFTAVTRLVDFSEAYLCLMGDVPLGMVMAGCIAAFFSRQDGSGLPAAPFLLGLAALGLVKETGFALALIVLVLALFDGLLARSGAGWRRLAGLGAAGLAVVLLPYFGWSRYIGAVTAADTSSVGGEAGMDQLTLLTQGLRETFGLAPRSEELDYVLQAMGDAFWRRGISVLGSCAAVLAVLGLLCLLAALGAGKGGRLRPGAYFVLSCGAFAAWYLFNCFLYAFVIKGDDRMVLANYARYIYPCLMGLVMGGICLVCAAMARRPAASPLRVAPAVLALALCWQTARLVPADKQLLGMSGAEFAARRAQRQAAETLASRFPDGEKAFVVSQGDNGLRWFQLCCDLLPAQVDYSFGGGQLAVPALADDPESERALTPDALDGYLWENGCTLMLLDEIDDAFIQSYGALFADGLQAAQEGWQLYRRGADGLFHPWQ